MPVIAVLAALALPAPSASAAAPGSLAFTGCVAESGGDVCGATGYGLSGTGGIAVSPDGRNVYAAGLYGRSVAVLDRGAGGALTFGQCFTSGGDAQCPALNTLGFPTSVAVSPDGSSVYVLSSDDLITFTRHADGSLTPLSCIGDVTAVGSCTVDSSLGQTLQTAAQLGAVMVSPDGSHVYTATDDHGGTNGAVDIFSRARNGSLTPVSCIMSKSSPDGSASCSKAVGLKDAGALALSPSGYLFVGGGENITSFLVQPDGSLAVTGCIGATSLGCSAGPNMGFVGDSPAAVAVTPDGAHLYAADNETQARPGDTASAR
jgi:DNA-binding beta-propeller fold protein YncE